MRSQFAFNIARGGCWSGKVRRYLRAAGLDSPVFLADEARQRHIHPRSKRSVARSDSVLPAAPQPLEVAQADGTLAVQKAESSNPFAQLGKKTA